MGRLSVQSAAAVGLVCLVCLDGVALALCCLFSGSYSLSLSLSLSAGLVVGDSWGQIGDIF